MNGGRGGACLAQYLVGQPEGNRPSGSTLEAGVYLLDVEPWLWVSHSSLLPPGATGCPISVAEGRGLCSVLPGPLTPPHNSKPYPAPGGPGAFLPG